MRLAGRSVVITGGSSGIGLATARAFLNEGASVAIVGRDPARLATAREALASDRLTAHQADVTQSEQVARLFAGLGRVDILVNNAGANIKERALAELTPALWDRLVRANLDSAYYCTYAVLPGMRERRDGVIVYVSSTAGKRATPLAGAGYCAAKFGMAALGICLGVEEREHGIRATNIYPGEVDTPILDARPKPPTPEQRAVILQPEDVAEAVLFVAGLPARAHVPELVIAPTAHPFL